MICSQSGLKKTEKNYSTSDLHGVNKGAEEKKKSYVDPASTNKHVSSKSYNLQIE